MEQIITSLLDLDYYKLTMHYAMCMTDYSITPVRYEFTCRTPNIDFSGCVDEIKRQIEMLDNLSLTKEEYRWLYVNDPDLILSRYTCILNNFKFDHRRVNVRMEDGKLRISVHGAWMDTILYETMILAIVNEVYYSHTFFNQYPLAVKEGSYRLQRKLDWMSKYCEDGFKYIEFGTRRRFSQLWQEQVVQQLMHGRHLYGTSNCRLAMIYGLKPCGTMAHEWDMAFYGMYNDTNDFLNRSFYKWCELFGLKNTIYLTDTFTTKYFLNTLDKNIATRIKGFRQDSGDPEVWAQMVMDKYASFGLDTKDRVFLFSDGLDVERAYDLYLKFKNQCIPMFGIGTSLTNDMGIQPLNIVMKLVESDGKPTIKVSDTPGKTMCESEELKKNFLNNLEKNHEC